MTDKELKKLRRVELLEMLLEAGRQIEDLKSKLASAEEKLNSRNIMIDNAGSIAEAAIQLNEVFAASQKAADQYLENIMHKYEHIEEICRAKEAESQAKAEQMIAEAQKICSEVIVVSNSDSGPAFFSADPFERLDRIINSNNILLNSETIVNSEIGNTHAS